MKRTIEAMMFAFKEIVGWDVMKYVVGLGTLVAVVWTGIGALAWHGLIALGSSTLELVPFSMVRSNGAWMLATFTWMQATLLTFALFYAFFGNYLLRHMSKERYSVISVSVLVLSGIVWALVWLAYADKIQAAFLKLLTWLPFETVEKGVAALIALYILYNGVIVTLLFLANIFADPMLKLIEIREFAEDNVVERNVPKTVVHTLKDTAIFLVASVVAFPLLFIPVINILVQMALWMWLYHSTIVYDAWALSSKENDPSILRKHRLALWFITFVAVLFNFIPVFNLFGPFFGIVAVYAYLRYKG